MSGTEPVDTGLTAHIQIAALNEVVELGLETAGEVWPTHAMALGRLFERGVAFFERGAIVPPLQGTASLDLLSALNEVRDELVLIEALYFLTRTVTFALTQDGASLEATWLAHADRHLEIRAEIVERRRDEEQLKRDLAALGGLTTPLPEHDDLPMVDGNRPRKSRGMFDRLFADAELVEAELDVAAPLLEAADRIAEERGWVTEWGTHARLLILTHGISVARRELEADEIDTDDDESVEAAQKMTRSRMMALDGRYATLRRRLFELRHNNRILTWRITALQVEAQGMRRRLDQFLADREMLERAIAERRAARPVMDDPASSPEPGGWRRRLSRLFGTD